MTSDDIIRKVSLYLIHSCTMTGGFDTEAFKESDIVTFEDLVGLYLLLSRSIRPSLKNYRCEHCLETCGKVVNIILDEYLNTTDDEAKSLLLVKVLYLVVEARTYVTFGRPMFPALELKTLTRVSEFCMKILGCSEANPHVQDFYGPWILKTLDLTIGQLSECEVDKETCSTMKKLKFEEILFPYLRSCHKIVSFNLQ